MSAGRWASALALLCALPACRGTSGDDANVARGRGLAPATLPTSSEVAAIEAATHAAFDVVPGLVLLLHPRRLPRASGYAGGDSVPATLVTALRARGVVRGTCDPVHAAPRDTPHCGTMQTGYVVRTSAPLQRSRDTLELYLAAETFGPKSGRRPVALRFEKIYLLVAEGHGWRVAQEARVHDEP